MSDILLPDTIDFDSIIRLELEEWAWENTQGDINIFVDRVLSRILATDTRSEVMILFTADFENSSGLFRLRALVDNENKLSSGAFLEMIIPGQGWKELVSLEGGFLNFAAMPSRNDIEERANYLVTLIKTLLNISKKTFFLSTKEH